MDKLLITGGRRLNGEITVSGAKNAALPILCASLLTADTLSLANVPVLNDIGTTLRLLRQLGVDAQPESDGTVTLCAASVNSIEAPYDLVKTMRASILITIGRESGRARVCQYV